jgi:membrane protein
MPTPFLPLLKEAYTSWKKDHAPQLAAALTYYTIFSLTPLLLVILAIIGFVYQQTPTDRFLNEIQSFAGKDVANTLKDMLEAGKIATRSGPAFILGTALTLFGSIGMFRQLKNALNLIWQIPEQKMPWKDILKRDVWLFLLIILSSLFLLASLSLGAVLSSPYFPFLPLMTASPWIVSLLHQLLSLTLGTLMVGILFKALPDKKIPWNTVWRAATVTSVVFALAKYAFGFYLAHSSISSAYGAAGSLVALLLWIYYSAQVFLFGVEIVKGEQQSQHLETSTIRTQIPKRSTFHPAVFALLAFGAFLKGKEYLDGKRAK